MVIHRNICRYVHIHGLVSFLALPSDSLDAMDYAVAMSAVSPQVFVSKNILSVKGTGASWRWLILRLGQGNIQDDPGASGSARI